MRVECYNSRYAYDTALPVSRLVSMVGNSIQYRLCALMLHVYVIGITSSCVIQVLQTYDTAAPCIHTCRHVCLCV